MPETYLIADTHWGHRKILTFEPERGKRWSTIAEHDEALVDNWNRVITKRDTVWHLGDVLFGRHSFVHLGRLKGIKKLVAGNHDQYDTASYAAHFRQIVGSAQIAGCILSHIPVHTSQFPRYNLNIHGHTHSRTVGDPRYQCVSVEQTDFQPIPLHEILRRAGLR